MFKLNMGAKGARFTLFCRRLEINPDPENHLADLPLPPAVGGWLMGDPFHCENQNAHQSSARCQQGFFLFREANSYFVDDGGDRVQRFGVGWINFYRIGDLSKF